MLKILAIETSCDESAAAVATFSRGKVKILTNVVSSQIPIHRKYGGVVPEVAARQHVLDVLPVIDRALVKKLDAIAVTSGPGLITSLIVGVETARALAYAWDLPLIGINHIAGHIYSNFIDVNLNQLKFPIIILTVSGGHNLLVLMKDLKHYQLLGETLDDACGEAFDKAAKMMGMKYPGGPEIALAAKRFRDSKADVSKIIPLPRPMINSAGFDFSFSGLKTALLYRLQKDKNWKLHRDQYAWMFEEAAAEVLAKKTEDAALKYHAKMIFFSGGVAMNDRIRLALEQKIPHDIIFRAVAKQYGTDNAAMIAAAALISETGLISWQKIKADSTLNL